MISLFTIPKPFTGENTLIQHNALQSWKQLKHCEIILMGSEQGVEEYAHEHGFKHMPEIQMNDHGTPLIHDVWTQARNIAQGNILAYVNCDIILMPNLADVVEGIHLDPYIAVCRRWDIDIDGRLDFKHPDWSDSLSEYVRSRGKLRHGRAIECHMFTRNTDFGEIPPFAVGRKRYDNWIVNRALEMKIPVIDLTPSVLAIHQNHAVMPKHRSSRSFNQEIQHNHSLAGGFRNLATTYDATHRLEASGLQQAQPGLEKHFYESVRRFFRLFPI